MNTRIEAFEFAASSSGKIINEYLASVSEFLGPRTTVQQLQVAHLLYRAGSGGLTPTHVARTLSISHSTATRHLERWRSLGRIETFVDEDDHRKSFYYICDPGIAKILQARTV